MSQITPHFSWTEATRTGTGIPNEPTPEARGAIVQCSAPLMEEIRALLGGGAIGPTSWYRSPEINAHPTVRGSRTSDHVRGYAVDWRHATMSGEACMGVLVPAVRTGTLMVDQLILYQTGMIHVSRRLRGNRNDIMRSRAPSGSGGPYDPWGPV